MSNSGKIWDIREAYKKQRGNQWIEPGNIGLYGGDNSILNTVDQINISNNGNATDFGDLTESIKKGAAAGALTRTVRCGGSTPSDVNTMDFANPFNAGNFVNFGDLTAAGQTTNTAHSNNVRGISSEGQGSPGTKNLNVFTIASQGNASQFGDVTQNDAIWSCGGGNNTRYFSAGAYPASNIICVKSIANDADCVDFGDLSASKWGVSQNSNPTRICFSGGQEPGKSTDIEFITIATAGNSTDFGDLTRAIGDTSAACNSIRGVVQGSDSPSTAGLDVFTLATTGNATDFGDTTRAFDQCFGASNGHGGIPQTDQFPQRPSVNYMPGSGRALLVGGEQSSSPYNSTKIEMFNIPTLGNASDFGDVTVAAGYGVNGTSNATRGLTGAGYVHPASSNAIRSTEIASQGNTSDFGDVTVARYYLGAAASTTRCLWTGGDTGSVSDVIDFKTFASAGNASDFGNLSVARGGCTNTTSSPTRSLMAGGYTPSNQDVIDYVTTASEGNATDFGNLTVARQMMGGSASSTRAVFGGGYTSSVVNDMDYVTIASTGDATDFGDLSVSRNGVSAVSNNIRAVFMAGRAGPSYKDTMDYVTIGSTGNAADFGDLTEAHSTAGNASDNHGGLQSS